MLNIVNTHQKQNRTADFSTYRLSGFLNLTAVICLRLLGYGCGTYDIFSFW